MKPIDRTHHTSDGPIRVWVDKVQTLWMARNQGPRLEGGRVFKTLKAANAHAEHSFAEMFPEHKCGKRCKDNNLPVFELQAGRRRWVPYNRHCKETQCADQDNE